MSRVRARSAGQRRWNSREESPLPVGPSTFERLAVSLGLKTVEGMSASEHLRKWAKANRNQRYVPEELLLKWGFEVHLEQGGWWRGLEAE